MIKYRAVIFDLDGTLTDSAPGILAGARFALEAEPALIQFAKRLKSYWRGIVSRVRWPMHTGQLEGINNRIKVIKRMAYGYRDSEFFFMKIKSVFPGNP